MSFQLVGMKSFSQNYLAILNRCLKLYQMHFLPSHLWLNMNDLETEKQKICSITEHALALRLKKLVSWKGLTLRSHKATKPSVAQVLNFCMLSWRPLCGRISLNENITEKASIGICDLHCAARPNDRNLILSNRKVLWCAVHKPYYIVILNCYKLPLSKLTSVKFVICRTSDYN